MTAAGDLKFRIAFQKKQATEAEGGGVNARWLDQFTRWADIRPLRGGETVQQDRMQGVQPVIIIVRADSQTRQITPSWRAVRAMPDGTERRYGLKTAQDMEGDNAFITFMAVAGDADGR